MPEEPEQSELAEPCMDRNPYPRMTSNDPIPNKPCARPQNHDAGFVGIPPSASSWGGGHSSEPLSSDPPVKGLRLIIRWEAADA